MAQHPKKMEWRKEVPHGLSASQFGMALGFSGSVADFVHYVRNIVGTELEFTGNVVTSHGINTEPKSRALYELLTATAVSDGGFYVLDDRLLGCSPDGRVFENVMLPPTPLNGTETLSSREKELALEAGSPPPRVPFRPKRERGSTSPTTSFEPEAPLCSKRVTRLLEIKSPYYALYDNTKRLCQPFGIPQQYLCQIQGQMAIADVDVCDFFVFLERPTCQVVAWRVHRCEEFWDWACPKLLQVVEWIRDGPPTTLTRSFKFAEFDFSKITVEPLIFPFDISNSTPICDLTRFPFFGRYRNPYTDPQCGPEHEGVLRVLLSPITRFLFDTNTSLSQLQGVRRGEEAVMWCNFTVNDGNDGRRHWNSLASGRDGGSRAVPPGSQKHVLVLVKPLDFSDSYVTCRVYAPGQPACCEGIGGCNMCVRKLRYFERELLSGLSPLPFSPDAGSLNATPCSPLSQKATTSLSSEACYTPPTSKGRQFTLISDEETSSCSSVEIIE